MANGKANVTGGGRPAASGKKGASGKLMLSGGGKSG